MVEGKEVTINNQTYMIAPLNLSGVEKYLALSEALTAAQERDKLDIVVDMLMLAFKRNYPEMTKEALKEMLDMPKTSEVMAIITEVSGLKKNQLMAV